MAVEKGSHGAFMAWFYFLLKVLYNRKCISEERCAPLVAEGLEGCGAPGELASLHILHLPFSLWLALCVFVMCLYQLGTTVENVMLPLLRNVS